jgi:hypothetical protein
MVSQGFADPVIEDDAMQSIATTALAYDHHCLAAAGLRDGRVEKPNRVFKSTNRTDMERKSYFISLAGLLQQIIFLYQS